MSYIAFQEVSNPGHKTRKWAILNTETKANLGSIVFHGAWRKYVFQPGFPFVIFDAKCLQDIIYFLNDATQQWRDTL